MLRALLLKLIACSPVLAADEAGFVELYEGKSLKGWGGDPVYWSLGEPSSPTAARR